MSKQTIARAFASIIFFFYTGGIVLLFSVDTMEGFIRFKDMPFTMVGMYIWGLIATGFGVFLWNDKGETL